MTMSDPYHLPLTSITHAMDKTILKEKDETPQWLRTSHLTQPPKINIYVGKQIITGTLYQSPI